MALIRYPPQIFKRYQNTFMSKKQYERGVICAAILTTIFIIFFKNFDLLYRIWYAAVG